MSDCKHNKTRHGHGHYPVAAPFAPPPAESPSSPPEPPPAPVIASIIPSPPVQPPPVLTTVPLPAAAIVPVASPVTAIVAHLAEPAAPAEDDSSSIPVGPPIARPVATTSVLAIFAGASSFTLGILALVFAFLPTVQFTSLPLAIAAVVVAFFGFSRSAAKFAACGMIAGLLALAIKFVDPSQFTDPVASSKKPNTTTSPSTSKSTDAKAIDPGKKSSKDTSVAAFDKPKKGEPERVLTAEEKYDLEQKLVLERTRLALLKSEQEQKELARLEQQKKEEAEKKKIEEEKTAVVVAAKKAEKEKMGTAIELLTQKLHAGTPEWTHGLEITGQYHRKKMTAIDVTSSVKKSGRGDVVWMSWKDLEHSTPTMTSAEGASRAKLQPPTKKAGVIEAAFLLAPDGKVTYLRITTPGGNALEAGETAATGNRLYGWHVLFSAMK